jgi:multicomponent Na+:H+ antiporter subunit G
MRVIVASSLLILGVAFVTIASFGVARMPDVFQRMHSATKAGGIGTTLVVLGVLVAGGVVHRVTGILTIVFMLLTLSIASQLLARAAYLSGGPIEGLDRGDPLEGILDRQATDASSDRPAETVAKPHG